MQAVIARMLGARFVSSHPIMTPAAYVAAVGHLASLKLDSSDAEGVVIAGRGIDDL